MNMMQLTVAMYRLAARLDDDPWIDIRLRQHGHLLQEGPSSYFH